MTQNTKRRIWCGGSLLCFLGGMILLTVLLFDRLVGFVRDPESFRQTVETLGVRGKLLFVFLMAAQVVLAVIPGHPFELAGGLCFGPIEGTFLVLSGAVLGSAINFALSRLFGLRAVTAFYSEEKLQKLFFLRESKRLNFWTFVTFLIPGIPKDMLAYFMGLTKMKFWVFLLISTAGRLPGILIAVLGGHAVQQRSLALFIVFGILLAVFLLFTLLLYRYQVRAVKEKKKTDKENKE